MYIDGPAAAGRCHRPTHLRLTSLARSYRCRASVDCQDSDRRVDPGEKPLLAVRRSLGLFRQPDHGTEPGRAGRVAVPAGGTVGDEADVPSAVARGPAGATAGGAGH